MKIRVFLFIAVFLSVAICSAQDNPLYFIVTGDLAYQGVRNEQGDTIIPVEYKSLGEFVDGQKVDSRVIDMTGLPSGTSFKANLNRAAQTFHTTFDRQGRVLYHPMLFDNGPDYIQEGVRRFVDINTGKMGLVHPDGHVVIPALYDFLTPLQNGYTTAYNGVERVEDDGGEHWTVKPIKGGSYSKRVLNRDGQVVEGGVNKTESLSVFNTDDFLFYPLYYRRESHEKLMLDSLEADCHIRDFVALDNDVSKLVIFVRPTEEFPYYVLGEVATWSDYLLVDEDHNVYYFDFKLKPRPLIEYLKLYSELTGK